MRTVLSLTLVSAALISIVACGGSDPAPAPKAEPAKVEEAPKAPEPVVEEPKADPAADFDGMSDDAKHAYLMELGKTVYETGGSGGVACQTCHQATGEGLPPSFPPLKGAKDWMKDCKTHAGYVVHGLSGEIEVAGVKYNGVMPAQPTLSDMEIAAAITFERMSWGNDYGHCMPSDVASAR